MQEKQKHHDAFEFYYSLGTKRSYPQVASKFTVSRTSVKKWAKAFNWQERVLIRDGEIANKVEKKTIDSIVEKKAKYLKMIDAAISTAFTKDESGKVLIKVGVEKVRDLKDLIDEALKLMGEPEKIEGGLKIIFEDVTEDD
jgi:hypothetical protein